MTSDVALWPEALRFAFQAAVVVVGWYVVHNLSARRDRDKARRDMIAKEMDVLSDAVDGLLVSARSYHLGRRDVDLELKIKMGLQDAGARVSALQPLVSNSADLHQLQRAVRELRATVTGRHFEDEHSGPLSESDDPVQPIAAACLHAKNCFTRFKYSEFNG